jgi:hypothetical protein
MKIKLLLSMLLFCTIGYGQKIITVTADRSISADTMNAFAVIYVNPTADNKKVTFANITNATAKQVRFVNIGTYKCLLNNRDTLSPERSIIYEWVRSKYRSVAPDLTKYLSNYNDTLEGDLYLRSLKRIRSLNGANILILDASDAGMYAGNAELTLSGNQDVIVRSPSAARTEFESDTLSLRSVVGTDDLYASFGSSSTYRNINTGKYARMAIDSNSVVLSTGTYPNLSESQGLSVKSGEVSVFDAEDSIKFRRGQSGYVAIEDSLENFLRKEGTDLTVSATSSFIASAGNGSNSSSVYLDPNIAAFYHSAPGGISSALESNDNRSYMYWENGSSTSIVSTDVNGLGFSTFPGTTYYNYFRTDSLIANATQQMPKTSGYLLNNNNTAVLTNKTWNGAVIGSSYGGAGTVNGLLKANGSGVVSLASSNGDYLNGTVGNTQVAYGVGSNAVGSSGNFIYNSTNRSLTIGKPYITDKIVIPSTAFGGITLHNQPDTTTNTETLVIRKSGNVFQIISSATGSGTQRELLLQGGGRGVRIGAFTGPSGFYNFSLATGSTTTNVAGIGINGIVSNSSATNNGQSFVPTYNQSGTAGFRCDWKSPFLQATGSGPQYLADWGTNTAADGAGTHTSSFIMDKNGTSFFGSGSSADLTTDKLSVYSSTLNQLKLANTSTNYFTVNVNSTANATFNLTASSGTPAFTFSDPVNVTGNLTLGTAGNGIYIKEGTNATSGAATLVAGTVVVSTTKVTANSRIQLTAQSLGTIVIPAALAVSARTAGTSFTILSSDLTDTSVVAWTIIEPAP